jgi:hypothetical protein
MKRRIVVWVTFLAGLYYVLEFLLPPTFGGAPDSAGAAGPTVIAGTDGDRLCYTGLAENHPPRLLAVSLPTTQRPNDPTTLLSPSFTRRDDFNGAQNAQFVPLDRLYYIGLGWDDKTPRVCLARLEGENWKPAGRAILDRGRPGEWDASGIAWVSVLPPAEGFPQWRMWYVGKQGDKGRVGYATSQDGLRWVKAGKPVLTGESGASIESVSVLTWLGEPRAWFVQRSAASPRGEMLTVTLSPATGAPNDTPEPVAWQAPELRFGNLPKEAIPLRDARAVAVGDEPRHVRLYLTFLGADGRPRITMADNFPVVGERRPTVFVREVKPLVEPGRLPHRNYLSDNRSTVDDLLVIVGAFAVGLGLISLAQVHGKRVAKLHRGWPESIAFFVATVAMAGFTLYQRAHPNATDMGTQGYHLLFDGLFQPLGSAMFSLLAAYLVSAAYRAFKVRTRDSALMAAAAMLIMLGQVPIGNLLTQGLPHPLQIPTLMAWVLAVTNNAVVRAVNFGVFVGALATALRIWLSLDRAFNPGEG